MRLLDRYLLREMLVPLGYCLGGFLVFWISFDLISEMDVFQEKKLHALEVLQYYLVKLPELLVVVLPVALLLGLLYALTSHARHHEIIAIRAAGVSLWRLSVPYLGVGLALSIGLLVLNELWVPDSAERAEQILERRQQNPARRAERKTSNLVFHNARDHRNWSIKTYHLDTHEMESPRVEWQLPDGSRRQILAERGLWTNGSWTFFGVHEFYYPAAPGSLPSPSQTNALTFIAFGETPDQIQSEIKISNLTVMKAVKKPQLSIGDILNYQRFHPQLDANLRAMLETQLHARLAAPWTCLVVVVIALPFGAPSGRRNVFVGVASSIFICFAYFVLLKLGLALGTGGLMPPWLAAWLPNIMFGGTGIWLTGRVR